MKKAKRPTPPQDRPSPNYTEPHSTAVSGAMRFDGCAANALRFVAAQRMTPISRCGCIRDPERDTHRCDSSRQPTERDVDGYAAAIAHLNRHGLMAAPQVEELRALWRRGGADRRLAQSVAQQWEVPA